MKLDRSDAGFSLSALIFFLAAASIFIAAAVPAYQMQAKREMEEELIFRGEEYTRAIQKYQRKFGVYPTSIDQLVSTNGLRFLRRAYKDPMTEKDFRFILVNPDGSLTGSKLFTQNTTNQSLFGDTQRFGQNSSQQTSPLQQQQTSPLQQQQTLPFQQQQTLPFQQQQTSPLQQQGQPFSQQTPGLRGLPNTQRGTTNNAFGAGTFGAGTTGGGLQQGQRNPQQPGGTSNSFGSPIVNSNNNPGNLGNSSGTPVASSGIIGVASDSSRESIKVYNNRQKYDEWEFVAILGQSGQGQQGQRNNQNQQNQNPQNPQNQNPQNQNQQRLTQPSQPGFRGSQQNFPQNSFGTSPQNLNKAP
jgi:hypothetical protein